MNEKELERLCFELLDETISAEDFDRLQDVLARDPEARRVYLSCVRMHQALGEVGLEVVSSDADAGSRAVAADGSPGPVLRRSRQRSWLVGAMGLVVAASALAAVVRRWYLPARPRDSQLAVGAVDGEAERLIAGHATLRHAVGVRWDAQTRPLREGDVIDRGRLGFDSGTIEIDLFCGARLVVEGPAELEIVSDWSVELESGRLRALVPPAARGFVVRAAEHEIVDLGTEFAISVADDGARVAVVDGEVELRSEVAPVRRLTTGQAQQLKGDGGDGLDLSRLATVREFDRRFAAARRQRWQQWQAAAERWAEDPRTIAYFPIHARFDASQRLVPSAGRTGGSCNALAVGPVATGPGRFGEFTSALSFERPGARLRTLIDGEFSALTLSCWVRIDSLQNRYNALFMADGYENGEPHWQIRDDGRMMLSVMVDDSQDVEFFNKRDRRLVRDAGLHRVYYTPPIWSEDDSGQWLHLAAVYDPENRRVRQYVNGAIVSEEVIADRMLVRRLRIGAAEIGNWGQPFRDTPWFAVRNLDGMIDEMWVLDAALSADEIRQLYEMGKPLGY